MGARGRVWLLLPCRQGGPHGSWCVCEMLRSCRDQEVQSLVYHPSAGVCCVHVPCWCCAMLSRYSRIVLARVSWLEVESRYRLYTQQTSARHVASPRLAKALLVLPPYASPTTVATSRAWRRPACPSLKEEIPAAPRISFHRGWREGPQRITSPSTSLRLAEAWAPKAWGQSDSNGCLRSRGGKPDGGTNHHVVPRLDQVSGTASLLNYQCNTMRVDLRGRRPRIENSAEPNC